MTDAYTVTGRINKKKIHLYFKIYFTLRNVIIFVLFLKYNAELQ